MSIKKIAIRSVLAVTAIAIIIASLVYFRLEPVPQTVDAAVVDSKTHDQRYKPVISTVSQKLDGYRESLTAPSLSVAVAVDGELVWSEALGFTTLETEEFATTATAYAIGSVSKPMTAALVAALWEEGELDLDTDVREYVADFPEKSYPITLRQLLSHQAGIRHYEFAWSLPTFSEMGRNESFDSIGQSMTIFKDDDLLFEPDTSFRYSTYGYTLISAAVEGATGRSFLELMKDRVYVPIGMVSTSADNGLTPGRADEYLSLFSSDAVLPAPETDSSYKWAGGGLVSTPTDLALFGVAMLRNQLLSDQTTETVFTPRETADGELNPQHYGLGWRIGGIEYAKDASSEPVILPLIHHGGSSIGSATILMMLPEQEIVVAMAANSIGRGGSGPLTSVAASVLREFLSFRMDAAEQLSQVSQ